MESQVAQTWFELPVWAEDGLELLTVLSLLQKTGLQEGSTGPGSIIESWIKKKKNTTQEFSFHYFCLCFPSRVLSVLQLHSFGE